MTDYLIPAAWVALALTIVTLAIIAKRRGIWPRPAAAPGPSAARVAMALQLLDETEAKVAATAAEVAHREAALLAVSIYAREMADAALAPRGDAA
jgi:hypothetical protein